MSAAQDAFDAFRPTTAWKDYFPTASRPWAEERIAHLYRRAAFAPTKSQIEAALELTPGEVVESILNGGRGQNKFEDDAARLEEGILRSDDPEQLKALWMFRLMNSPHALEERMTLFWHDHFATSNAKVDAPSLMWEQNQIFRRHALGNFGEMLQEIARDPATLIWLDSNTNVKGKPNENLAREIFELFSLGVGNYTEKDIQEAARALTGWDVDNGKARFQPANFDATEKTILGQTGNWGAGDVVRIALRQPACSKFLVRKLFAELISETVTPSEEMLEPLTSEFRIRNYDIRWLVEKMLRSWVFFSDAALQQKVKGPVDFVTGTVRALEGRVSPLRLSEFTDQLNQSLFYPPSVKGWDAGAAWLNSTTLLYRQNLVFELTKGSELGARTDPARLTRKYNIEGEDELIGFFLELFLQNPEHDSRSQMVEYLQKERGQLEASFFSPRMIAGRLARSAAHLVLTTPEYQIG